MSTLLTSAEYMIMKCRPFYLPRRFTTILLTSVYIPLTSNSSEINAALNELYQAISEQQDTHPDGFLILIGAFSHGMLTSVHPKLYQLVDFTTRGNNILDLTYTTHKGPTKPPITTHLTLWPLYYYAYASIQAMHESHQIC